jgi:hypothetical protein
VLGVGLDFMQFDSAGTAAAGSRVKPLGLQVCQQSIFRATASSLASRGDQIARAQMFRRVAEEDVREFMEPRLVRQRVER